VESFQDHFLKNHDFSPRRALRTQRHPLAGRNGFHPGGHEANKEGNLYKPLLTKPQRRRETLHKGETAVTMRNTWGWKKDVVRVQHVVVLPCMSFMLFMAKSSSRSSWF
jgi:hypothetical protein